MVPLHSYSYGKKVFLEAPRAVHDLAERLVERGFVFFFQGDVQELLGRALQLHFRHYFLLSVGRPQGAAPALAAEPTLGLLFPCHLAVFEEVQGESMVVLLDTQYQMEMLQTPAAMAFVLGVKGDLEEVLEEL